MIVVPAAQERNPKVKKVKAKINKHDKRKHRCADKVFETKNAKSKEKEQRNGATDEALHKTYLKNHDKFNKSNVFQEEDSVDGNAKCNNNVNLNNDTKLPSNVEFNMSNKESCKVKARKKRAVGKRNKCIVLFNMPNDDMSALSTSVQSYTKHAKPFKKPVSSKHSHRTMYWENVGNPDFTYTEFFQDESNKCNNAPDSPTVPDCPTSSDNPTASEECDIAPNSHPTPDEQPIPHSHPIPDSYSVLYNQPAPDDYLHYVR